ncbi:MAG TPA: phosphopantothenoylcysteine decarboxylase, partial [Rhodocyclaceae bacterium]|nr:phosphopantothenoylcysteine decarboxylase [Rhodocyclaceae bacterium]
EPEELFDALVYFFQPKKLAGRRVLLTAGPTFEPLDPVRGITNSSSGKMGFSLARACAEAGAEVTVVAGPSGQATPHGVRRIDVQSALEMREAVLAQLPTDIFIAVAAVDDYRPVQTVAHKIKKQADTLTVELTKNPDILAEVAGMDKPPFCVGFAAESQDLAEYAEAKRRAKKLPLVVGNLVQDGLGGDANQVTLFAENGVYPLPAGDKLTIARSIVNHIAGLLEVK